MPEFERAFRWCSVEVLMSYFDRMVLLKIDDVFLSHHEFAFKVLPRSHLIRGKKLLNSQFIFADFCDFLSEPFESGSEEVISELIFFDFLVCIY